MPLPLLVPLAIMAAQMGARAIAQQTNPTRRYNAQQIKELKAKIERGEGLSPEEKAALGAEALTPARTLVGQSAMEAARFQTATGGVGGGAAAQQRASNVSNAVGQAAEKAGMRIGELDQQAKDQNKAELEARLAAKSTSRMEYIGDQAKAVGSGISGMAKVQGLRQVGVDATKGMATTADAANLARRAFGGGGGVPAAAAPAGATGRTAEEQAMIDRQLALSKARMDAAQFAPTGGLAASPSGIEQARSTFLPAASGAQTFADQVMPSGALLQSPSGIEEARRIFLDAGIELPPGVDMVSLLTKYPWLAQIVEQAQQNKLGQSIGG